MTSLKKVQDSNSISEDTKTLITALALLLAFPVGLILMWLWTNWPNWLKVIITAIPLLIVIFVSSIIAFIFSLIPRNDWQTSHPTTSQIQTN